jgi:hypothetical protein
VLSAVVAMIACSATGAPGGTCVPNPADCAGKCGQVTDPCGGVVACGDCSGGLSCVASTCVEGGGGGDGGGTGGSSSGSGIQCYSPQPGKCICQHTPVPPSEAVSSCTPETVSGVCCADNAWPEVGTTCLCWRWGCSAATSPCTCQWGAPAGYSPTCTPAAGDQCGVYAFGCTCGTGGQTGTAVPSCTASEIHCNDPHNPSEYLMPVSACQ